MPPISNEIRVTRRQELEDGIMKDDVTIIRIGDTLYNSCSFNTNRVEEVIEKLQELKEKIYVK